MPAIGIGPGGYYTKYAPSDFPVPGTRGTQTTGQFQTPTDSLSNTSSNNPVDWTSVIIESVLIAIFAGAVLSGASK